MKSSRNIQVFDARRRRSGYEVEILEAASRAGGRNFTVRRGDEIEQIGRDPQECRFDADHALYLNAGPGRIPITTARCSTIAASSA